MSEDLLKPSVAVDEVKWSIVLQVFQFEEQRKFWFLGVKNFMQFNSRQFLGLRQVSFLDMWDAFIHNFRTERSHP